MRKSIISKEEQEKISALCKTMDDSPGEHSDKLLKEWLAKHKLAFSRFIDNEFLKVEKEGSYLCCGAYSGIAIDKLSAENALKEAFQSSEKQKENWFNLTGFERSSYLYRIAETLEKHSELFVQVESASSDKQVYRTKKDVSNLIQSFNYYAGVAGNTKYSIEENNHGVVCVVAERCNLPLVSLSCRVASILAAGNVVLLIANAFHCYGAFLLAELCKLSGLPAGVLNVLQFMGTEHCVEWPLSAAIKVIYTAGYSRNLSITNDGAPAWEVLFLERPVVIVYESADLPSAANGVFEMLCCNDNSGTKRSGCSVYVQSSIKEKFYSLLETKISEIKLGWNFSKTADLSSYVSEGEMFDLLDYIRKAHQQQFKVVEPPELKTRNMCEIPPTLIFDVPTTSDLLKERPNGPLIITTPFRTVKESIAMFNHNKLGSDVSIWTEKLPLALEVGRKLRTRTVWVNTQNMFDPAISYGGLGLSGNSIEGGTEGYFTRFNAKAKKSDKVELYGKETPKGITLKDDPNIKLNYELHIGGSYKKPSGGSYTIVKSLNGTTPYAYVGLASSTDIQAAVSSAMAVQQKWENLGKTKRLQVLRKAAKALMSKEKELMPLLNEITGKDSKKEFYETVALFQLWSNETNYSDGKLIETESCGKVLQERYSLGVIGIQVFDVEPLLSFVSTVVPAIAYGNAVVAMVKNELCSIPAFKVCEILQSSGLLGGVVNVTTGCQEYLTRHLASNMSVDSVWYSQEDATSFLHSASVTHPKRVHYCKYSNGVQSDQRLQEAIVSESTYLKSIFMPMGDIFAN